MIRNVESRKVVHAGAGVLAALLLAGMSACLQTSDAVVVDADDIGGVVSGANGPEAGVWVIAETDALPTKFIRIVVTDEQGRYLLPDMPDASFDVFVRGYGLVDSQRVVARPGQQLHLSAVAAPDARAAARVYPANEWLSLAAIPEGPLDTQQVVSTIKACMACHQVGDESTRRIPESFETFDSHLEAWDRRVQSGQMGAAMNAFWRRLGDQKAMFADWSDRIAGGELPPVPTRPEGIERNIVITQWDWADPTTYLHDEASTDKRDPTVNPYGPIYGALEASADYTPVLNPADHSIKQIPVPVRDPNTPLAAGGPMAPSIYWGDEAIWDSQANVHNPMLDARGRVWLTSRIRPAENPDMCLEGSDHPSAKAFPTTRAGRHLAVYDPATDDMTLIGTCFGS